MRTPIVDAPTLSDEVSIPERSTGDGMHAVASTVAEAIDRARQLVAHYETGRVLLREATGSVVRDLVAASGESAAATRRRRRRGTRRRAA